MSSSEIGHCKAGYIDFGREMHFCLHCRFRRICPNIK